MATVCNSSRQGVYPAFPNNLLMRPQGEGFYAMVSRLAGTSQLVRPLLELLDLLAGILPGVKVLSNRTAQL